MEETYVQLECPDCGKDWERTVTDLPGPESEFQCPDCGTYSRLSEFARTKRDFETLEQFA